MSMASLKSTIRAYRNRLQWDCDRMVLLDNIWMPMGDLPKLQTIDIKSEPIKLEAVPETSKLSQGQVTWERLKVGSPAYPNARDPIDIGADEVETTAIDERPEGLDNFPLVLTIWEYLDGKDARSMKQISGAMKTDGKISDDILTAKLGQF